MNSYPQELARELAVARDPKGSEGGLVLIEPLSFPNHQLHDCPLGFFKTATLKMPHMTTHTHTYTHRAGEARVSRIFIFCLEKLRLSTVDLFRAHGKNRTRKKHKSPVFLGCALSIKPCCFLSKARILKAFMDLLLFPGSNIN